MYRIMGERVDVAFDAWGRLITFRDRRHAHNYAGGRPVWRLYGQRGSTYDREIVPSGTPRVNTTGTGLCLHWPDVVHEGETLAIAVRVTVAVVGADDVRWTLEVRNNQAGWIVRDAHFPLFGNLCLRPDQDFIWSRHGGERYRQDELRHRLADPPKLYMEMDQVYRELSCEYPGNLAMNCFVFAGADFGFYLGGHLADLAWTDHQLRLYHDRELEAGMVRYLNLRPGEQATLDPFVASAYQGSWHMAAAKYRAWADSWWTPPEPPAWMRRANGWQRVIMKHQYGEIHYRFADMARMHAEGMSAGIDTLLMFGWHRGGHDHNYPAYVPDPELGSRDDLIAGIAAVQDAGGHVLMYSSGRLIDVAGDFYRNGEGQRICVKDHAGVERRESYRFRGLGNFARHFANRTLVPACPSCEPWFEQLVAIADTALDCGAHGVFYDQMGLVEWACSDPAHDHPPEWLGSAPVKAHNIARLRTHVRRQRPEMTVGIEILTDVAAASADYVHSLTGGCVALNDWLGRGEKPRLRHMLEFFRFAFPEVIVSDRDIRDDTDIERRVNHALLKGLRSDVEIYRCRRTIAETPRYRSYLTRANALRQRQAAFLLEGRYCDTLGFAIDNDEVDARAFAAGDRLAVVLTQSHLETAAVSVHAPAYTPVAHDGMGAAKVQFENGAGRVTLPRHALAVVLFAPGSASSARRTSGV